MTTVQHVVARQWTSIAGIGVFQAMAILFLLLTLVGFAPTFYLRSWFEVSPLPLRTHVHGLFATLCIMVLLAQTLLIARGEVALHRRMGLLSIAVGGSLVVSGLAILYSSESLSGGQFGYGLDISRSHLAIGSPRAGNLAGRSGEARIYRFQVIDPRFSDRFEQ